MACAQSFILWKHATKQIGGRYHCIAAYSHHLRVCAMLGAHPIGGASRIQHCAYEVVATRPMIFATQKLRRHGNAVHD